MSRNAISDNPEHYLFKLFWGSMPPDPLKGPKKIFLPAAPRGLLPYWRSGGGGGGGLDLTSSLEAKFGQGLAKFTN